MRKKISARISSLLAAATMALSMQTSLNAAAVPPKNLSDIVTENGMVMTPIGEFTQNNIVYELFDGNQARIKDGKAASGTIQIPDAIYTNGTYYIVKTIGKSAFYGNNNITAVDMKYASGLTAIDFFAFSNCKNLETVALPKNLKINDYFFSIFDGCDSLNAFMPTYGADYNIIDGIVYNNDNTEILKYPSAKLGDSFTLPEGVTALQGSFKDLKYLKSIIVTEEITGDNVKDIFNRCKYIISGIQGNSFTINGIDPFIYSEDDSEEPQILPLFRDVVYDSFYSFTNITDYYAKRYAQYVVKKYVDMENDTDFIKALKLHNWLCDRVKYDPVIADILAKELPYIGDSKNQCDASAFLHYEKAGGLYKQDGFYTVCNSYSRAYSLLLNAAGVCCEAITSDPKSGKYGHAWNVVKLNAYDDDPTNDKCYYVDTTWDDEDTGWNYKNFMCSDDPKDFGHTEFINWRIFTNNSNGSLNALPEKSFSIKTIGDLNEDGFVTGADLKILEDYSNSGSWSDVQRANADLNFDGVIDDNDVAILSEYVYSRIGDVNGSGVVDKDDYASLKHYLRLDYGILDYMKIAADANMDGNIDSADLEAIESMYGQVREQDRQVMQKTFFELYFEKILQNLPEDLKN